MSSAKYTYTRLGEETETFHPRTVCVHYPYLWTKECADRYGNNSGSREGCQGMGPVDSYPGMYTGFPVSFEYTQAGSKKSCNGEPNQTPGIY